MSNATVFTRYRVLGCPSVLPGDLGDLPVATLRLLTDPAMIDLARRGLGRVARCHDPWHVKRVGEGAAFAMILNRWQGDQPANLLPEDVGWQGRFSLRAACACLKFGRNVRKFTLYQ